MQAVLADILDCYICKDCKDWRAISGAYGPISGAYGSEDDDEYAISRVLSARDEDDMDISVSSSSKKTICEHRAPPDPTRSRCSVLHCITGTAIASAPAV